MCSFVSYFKETKVATLPIDVLSQSFPAHRVWGPEAWDGKVRLQLSDRMETQRMVIQEACSCSTIFNQVSEAVAGNQKSLASAST